MTVLTDTVKNDYVGDGVQTAFQYEFKVFRREEIKAYVDSVEDTNITVSGLGADGGGTVTFAVAPADQSAVRLIREMEYKQIVDYTAYDPFPSESHEMALDRLLMLLQQIGFELGGVIRSEDYENLLWPAFSSGEYFRWNTDSMNPSIETGVPVAQTVDIATDGEAVDGVNQTPLIFNPEQLLLAVQAHIHSVSTNPPIQTVASLPGTPQAGVVYLVTT